MQAGAPDPDTDAAVAPSLMARVRGGGVTVRRGEWRIAAAIAGLIALGPVMTIAGAALLTGQARRATQGLEATLAPRIAAQDQAMAGRKLLGDAAARPLLSVVLDRLARVLPADADLQRAERKADGAIEFDIITSDPDGLRAALRRSPDLAGLRDTSQRRGDAGMVVSLRAEPR
jgi:hypothetical protein